MQLPALVGDEVRERYLPGRTKRRHITPGTLRSRRGPNRRRLPDSFRHDGPRRLRITTDEGRDAHQCPLDHHASPSAVKALPASPNRALLIDAAGLDREEHLRARRMTAQRSARVAARRTWRPLLVPALHCDFGIAESGAIGRRDEDLYFVRFVCGCVRVVALGRMTRRRRRVGLRSRGSGLTRPRATDETRVRPWLLHLSRGPHMAAAGS